MHSPWKRFIFGSALNDCSAVAAVRLRHIQRDGNSDVVSLANGADGLQSERDSEAVKSAYMKPSTSRLQRILYSHFAVSCEKSAKPLNDNLVDRLLHEGPQIISSNQNTP